MEETEAEKGEVMCPKFQSYETVGGDSNWDCSDSVLAILRSLDLDHKPTLCSQAHPRGVPCPLPALGLTVVHHGDILSLTAHHLVARSVAIQDGSEGLLVCVAYHGGKTCTGRH